jgi:hypothetical protein
MMNAAKHRPRLDLDGGVLRAASFQSRKWGTAKIVHALVWLVAILIAAVRPAAHSGNQFEPRLE